MTKQEFRTEAKRRAEEKIAEGEGRPMNRVEGWQRTLDLLERGELSNDEVDALMQEVQRAIEDCIGRLCGGGAAAREARQLMRVLGKFPKALEKVLAVRSERHRR